MYIIHRDESINEEPERKEKEKIKEQERKKRLFTFDVN